MVMMVIHDHVFDCCQNCWNNFDVFSIQVYSELFADIYNFMSNPLKVFLAPTIGIVIVIFLQLLLYYNQIIVIVIVRAPTKHLFRLCSSPISIGNCWFFKMWPRRASTGQRGEISQNQALVSEKGGNLTIFGETPFIIIVAYF